MEMDQIGVCDVGIPDEPPPESAGEGKDDPGPQWLRVLLWRTSEPREEVWVTCQAEEQPPSALDVRVSRKPKAGEQRIHVRRARGFGLDVPLTNIDELSYLLTIEEVARLFRTTVGAIYAMAERGQIPGVVRQTRKLLFHRDRLKKELDRVANGKGRQP